MPAEWNLENHGNILAALRTPIANKKSALRRMIDKLRKKILMYLSTFTAEQETIRTERTYLILAKKEDVS